MTGLDSTADKGFPFGDDQFAECPRCGIKFEPVKVPAPWRDTLPEVRNILLKYGSPFGIVFDTTQKYCDECLEELYLEKTFDIYGNCRKCGQQCCDHTGGCGRCDKCL